jgi:hypothetical protein
MRKKDGNNKLQIVSNKPVLSEAEWIQRPNLQIRNTTYAIRYTREFMQNKPNFTNKENDIRNTRLFMQNKPNSETNIEPKAKSEPVPTRRERAGKPQSHQSIHSSTHSLIHTIMQNEPNLPNTQRRENAKRTQLQYPKSKIRPS